MTSAPTARADDASISRVRNAGGYRNVLKATARAGGLVPSSISTTAALTPSCDVPDIRPIASIGPRAISIAIGWFLIFFIILRCPARQPEHLHPRRDNAPSRWKLQHAAVGERAGLDGYLASLMPLHGEHTVGELAAGVGVDSEGAEQGAGPELSEHLSHRRLIASPHTSKHFERKDACRVGLRRDLVAFAGARLGLHPPREVAWVGAEFRDRLRIGLPLAWSDDTFGAVTHVLAEAMEGRSGAGEHRNVDA